MMAPITHNTEPTISTGFSIGLTPVFASVTSVEVRPAALELPSRVVDAAATLALDVFEVAAADADDAAVPFLVAVASAVVVITTGVVMTGVVMTGVVMTGVVITGVVMTGVVITGVVMTGVVMTGVVMTGVVITGVVTTGVVTGGVVTGAVVTGTVAVVAVVLGVGVSQNGRVMTLSSKVTAPVLASNLPTTVAP
jgi:hypothetical protein